jgi:hypothetical protein
MNAIDLYNFDRMGYLHIPGFLSKDVAAHLLAECKALEAHALASAPTAPKFKAIWGPEVWQNPEHGYFFLGRKAPKDTLIIDDFWMYPSAFDFLIGHPPTVEYIKDIVQGEFTINNSELRIRYTGNATGMHMGFPHGHGPKYSYKVMGGKVHCNMVRMVYFLHDVDITQGPICFVPGSHRAELPCPNHTAPVEEEAGVTPILVKAGDGVLFTEACRHGGFINHSEQTRYTLHVGYGPAHLRSQNISTIDEDQNVSPALLGRISGEQARMLVRNVRKAI